MASRAHDPLLGANQGESAEGGVNGCGAERAGELSQPVREQGIQIDVATEVVLMRGDITALTDLTPKHLAQHSNDFYSEHIGYSYV